MTSDPISEPLPPKSNARFRFATIPTLLAVVAIHFYRRHLSHRKGYACAWGKATGRDTCSGVGLRAFRRAGWVKGWALLRFQFDRCALAAQQLRAAESARFQPRGRQLRQGGFVDCSPDCDGLPGCDSPDCGALPRTCCDSGCCTGPDAVTALDCCGDRQGKRESRLAEASRRLHERQQRRRERREAGLPAEDAASRSEASEGARPRP